MVVGSATDFSNIISFAKKLGSTYILLPRGKFRDMYDNSSVDVGKIVYQNLDYAILDLNI